MKQSSKQNTLRITKPVSLDPITAIKQVTEDASAWPTVLGAKQKNGVAYCDGSTLTNTDGIYDDFLAAHGSLVLPNGPFSTGYVGNSICAVTSPNTPLTQDYVRVKAYTDISGNWRLCGNIRLSNTINTGMGVTVQLSGVVFSSGEEQSIDSNAIQSSGNLSRNLITRSATNPNTDDIVVNVSSGINRLSLSFDVALESKPTWADANLESYPVINLQTPVAAGALGLPAATATEAGTVTPEDQTFSGKKTFTETTTGNIFESYSSKTVLSSSSPTLVANGVVNNLSGMYMVTISRSGTGASYSAMSNAFINITSSSSAVLSHVRQDPDCTITASGGRVFAQASALYNGQTYKATFVCLMRFE